MSIKTLIIEDNENNMYLISFLLQNNGHDVSQAYDGQDGVSLAKSVHPDLILLDIQLPKMNGYEVALELRKDESLKNVPIVAITSYAMPGDQEKALSAGCSGYIKKPINPDTFLGEIESYLDKK
ncbi:MAG: response regulator [Candidatus Marinimicrobia bacterium]|jgi:two-component system cell cycle response regulator DivK|nr:response regulator [Candidatus Neomarinimicrobiota bacterium]MBT3679468.1 response regulator [Candidatus Neomarinimicrobiota bacterium]MBT3951063.1 response regulator [Candidatus Neomarinimicrobiota bacterium]MBT4254257.1 response regulator [Candidatus Neomarinimicrobiota bacterium]MBT4479438.1 response regulator [Candidatus Neomarinimicrobiota bacterium]